MEMKNIIKLIQTVSESSLTSFKYTEGDSSLSLEINRNAVYGQTHEIQATPAFMGAETDNDKADSNKLIITSPMVGTFYETKSEDGDPYIAVGDRIKKGQIIGIVEAMKLMNEIESAYDGIVEAILVKNRDMVEYGQALVSIRPL